MRYLPLSPDDRSQMLGAIGVPSVDDLFKDVPQSARRDGLLELPMHQGELEVERAMGAMAARNRSAADACIRAGISSERSSRRNSAIAQAAPAGASSQVWQHALARARTRAM